MRNTEKQIDKMEKQARLDTMNIVGKLPHELILKILSKLDVESLCASAPVSRSFNSSVSLTLSSLCSLDLTEFSFKSETVGNLVRNNKTIQSLKLDCSRLDDSSIYLFLKESLQELVLLRCFHSSNKIFTAIGEKCPKLRKLMLEVRRIMVDRWKSMKAIEHIFNGCMLLESLHIQFPKLDGGVFCFENHKPILPKHIKTIFLQPITCEQALLLIPMLSGLQSLTLVVVVDQITDELLVSVSHSLPNLTELCLEDKPWGHVSLNHDLSNNGLLAISFCKKLKRLSLTRGRDSSSSVSFKQVDDVGILHLVNGLDQLEFVRLAGFYNVTDAGYSSILHLCKNIRRYEIDKAIYLSDLAFHDLLNAPPRCLVDLRLTNCEFLIIETGASLSFCKNLEILDLSGCENISDLGLISISKLCRLVKLDLSGADVTDDGLSSLGMCSSPITSLSLRGCERVTDRGISMLFNGESSINKTLTKLDIGHIPAVSDRVVASIAKHCEQLTNLSIRYCSRVSDDSIKALGLKTVAIRRLDLYNCRAVKSLEYFSPPYFSKVRWLGVGHTNLCNGNKYKLVTLLSDRCGLRVCLDGCKMYCNV